MSNKEIFKNLKSLIQSSDLASKDWISQQYDSQVMNDTIAIGGDAAVVRVHGTNKALAITSDCTPRYVQADAFEGAKQAVAETYRNICCVGGKPLAITNCLNFGNPQKPEIMGQIVRAIKGINEACKFLDYPVVSGNVSLYNETDGVAIQPTPAIGGVGLLKDLTKRADTKFKNIGDIVFVIGKTSGHLDCSLYEREILKKESQTNPPKVDLDLEKTHGDFVRNLIENQVINVCHDVSDGGILVALFEMCNKEFGVKVNYEHLDNNLDKNAMLFGEDQGRYIAVVSPSNLDEFRSLAEKSAIDLLDIGFIVAEKIEIDDDFAIVEELQKLNQSIFPDKFK